MCWILLIAIGKGIIYVSANLFQGITTPVMMIGAFGPLVGALFATYKEFGSGSILKFLRTFLDLRLGWKAYFFSLIIIVTCGGLAWIIPEFYGEERLPMLLPSIWLFFPNLLLMIFLGGGQEEFGWRGYALPRLENRLGLWKANIILGIIHGCWHIPLWFMEWTAQVYMPFIAFLLMTVGLAFIYSWILSLSGNKPFAGLFVHGLANGMLPLLPVIIFDLESPQLRFWLFGAICFTVGLIITFYRKRFIIIK